MERKEIIARLKAVESRLSNANTHFRSGNNSYGIQRVESADRDLGNLRRILEEDERAEKGKSAEVEKLSAVVEESDALLGDPSESAAPDNVDGA